MSIASSDLYKLPSYTADSLLSELGDIGRHWIDGFPELVDNVSVKYGFTGESVVGGSRSACLLGTNASGEPVVLKLTPYREELHREAGALRHWLVSGVVPRVFDMDQSLGLLVLERILPGTPLGFPDAPGPGSSPAAIGRTLAALRTTGAPDTSAAVCPLDHRHDYAQRRLLSDPAWTGFRPLIDWAHSSALAMHREALAGSPVLIHGDFQPKNLLIGPGGSIYAIDPLATLGDPCFDAALWAVTDLAAPPIDVALEELVSTAGLPLKRCLDWALLLGVFEHRPARRRELSVRIEHFVDGRIDQIDDAKAVVAWIHRPSLLA